MRLMRRRLPFLLLLTLLPLLPACREPRVEHYRVPKETAIMPASDKAMASATVPTGRAQLIWTTPDHWVAKEAGPMRKGSYAIVTTDGEADLSITAFPGDTGGLAANLNRWRGQIGLAPLTSTQLEESLLHLDANGLHFDVVDFTGEAGGVPVRILGAVLNRPGETWFFKISGPEAVAAGEKPAFINFLKTVKAP
jgi:hypothetical protein